MLQTNFYNQRAANFLLYCIFRGGWLESLIMIPVGAGVEAELINKEVPGEESLTKVEKIKKKIKEAQELRKK